MRRGRRIEAKKKRSGAKLVFGFVAGVLTIATVVMVVRSSVRSSELVVLEKQRMELERENKKLASEVVKNTSLAQVRKEAESLGMGRPEETVYFNVGSVVAELQVR